MRCFSIVRADITGPLSPLFYLDIPKAKHSFVSLKSRAVINPRRNIGKTDLDKEVPYVGLPEADDGKIRSVILRPYREVKGRNTFQDGDILFARIEPSIFNKKYIYAENLGFPYAFTSTEFIVIRAKEGTVPKFIFYTLFMDTVFNQVKGKTTGSTGRRRLDRGTLEEILIPDSTPSEQKKIVKLLDNAHIEKQRLEQEADDLLASIDAYILDRLGIKLSTKATKKFYTVSSQTITGKRLDPLYYSQEILKFVEALPYEHPNIGSKVQYMKTGFAAGRSEQELENFDEAIIQIRPTNMSNARTLIFDKNIHINKSVLKDKPDALLKRGEVLFNNTNSQDLVGKTVYFDEDGEYVCSNHVTRIKTDPNEIDGYYLFCILNLYQRLRVFYSICTNWNNQSGVNADLLASLPIPKPDVKIQKEIANEVRMRMTKAATLKIQALYQLDQAKAEVEKILFGDG